MAAPRNLTVRRVHILSFAKFYGVLMGLLGLLSGLVLFLFGLAGTALFSGLARAELEQQIPVLGELTPLLAGLVGLCAAPLLYGLVGFVVGAVQAFIFNIAAGLVGGITLETE